MWQLKTTKNIHMKKKYFIFYFLLLFFLSAAAQKEMPLYSGIPNNKSDEQFEKTQTDNNGITRISNVSVPTVTIYEPQHPNGTAVIICPGGAYRILAINVEGSDVARVLNEWGITVFVLKYRLPDDRIMFDKTIAPLQDAMRAIQLVRENAKEWKINPKKIGIMGFSAGGHLAASLSTRYEEKILSNPKKTLLRPDFSILIYPVISFTDSLTHLGSRENLIGKRHGEWIIKKFSNELNVTKKTPPAFLVHAKDDKTANYNNSVIYMQALQKNKIPVTLKTFETGGHGFGMNNKTTDEKWMDDLKLWLEEQKLL
jgi:acetyl esterase/lipase